MKKFNSSEIKALAETHGVSRDAVRYAIRHDKLDKLGTGTSTRQKSSGMDLALSVMRSVADGWPCTLLDIAEVCGTSKEAVRQVEEKALRRLRSLLIEQGIWDEETGRPC
jgi:DNA-directed RNA polymerase sigma subunit (sigma70/sigma32)